MCSILGPFVRVRMHTDTDTLSWVESSSLYPDPTRQENMCECQNWTGRAYSIELSYSINGLEDSDDHGMGVTYYIMVVFIPEPQLCWIAWLGSSFHMHAKGCELGMHRTTRITELRCAEFWILQVSKELHDHLSACADWPIPCGNTFVLHNSQYNRYINSYLNIPKCNYSKIQIFCCRFFFCGVNTSAHSYSSGTGCKFYSLLCVVYLVQTLLEG